MSAPFFLARPGDRGARPGHAGTGGFTLIEVLLTLLIMSGILVTVTQILNAARRSRDEIHNIQEQDLAGPAILDRLERDLRGLFLFDQDPKTALRIQDRVVSGIDADTIDFVTSEDSLVPWRRHSNDLYRRSDYNEVGYRLRPRPDNDDFLELFRREGFGLDEDTYEGGRFALLHDRVKGFDVQIFEEDGPDAEPLEEWGTGRDERVGLPARIEITLTLELAPRLLREQLITFQKREFVYQRVIRFPEILRIALESPIMPRIPFLSSPAAETPGAAGAEAGGADASGGEGGLGGAEETPSDGGEAGNPFGDLGGGR